MNNFSTLDEEILSPIFLNDSFESNEFNYDCSNKLNCLFSPFLSDENTNIDSNKIILPDQNPEPIRSRHCKLLGRKKKDEELDNSNEGEHSKYYEDNMTRKLKVLLKDALLDIINSEIQKIKKKEDLIVTIDEKSYKIKKILNICQKQIKDTTIEGNKELLKKQLKKIFSDDIAGNYKKYPKDFNKAIIDKLYKTENNKKIVNILDITFSDCLKYYIKDKRIIKNKKFACLEGLEKHFEKLPKILRKKDDRISQDYINEFIDFIKNFEDIINNKTPRTKRKKIA
jgi:hypothetical protein